MAKAAPEPIATNEQLEKEFKEYSVAEFFKRNRQMLGYSGKVRSLTTIVHEYVTNSLDSCEEAGILPEINVEIQNVEGGDHLKVIVEDNGTGVPKSKIGLALGQLLAGTKFGQRAQKRGQQGIGASYATLFAQITTGKATHFKTGTGDGSIFEGDMTIDVKTNAPKITDHKDLRGKFRGLHVEGEFSEVTYNRSEYSVYEYLRRTALANPHAQITLVEPNKEITVFPRASKEVPKKPPKVLPHPLGITTSDLIDMAHQTSARKISSFLTGEFQRFSSDKLKEVQALIGNIDLDRAPKNLQWPEAEALVKAFQQIKWIAPETSAMIPIGEEQITKSLKNLLKPEQLSVRERKPKVFRGGIPFLVEAAIAYGGEAGVTTNEGRKGELLRFANRTPLLFDAGNDAISEAVKNIDWNRYDLKDWETQPVSIFVNFVSVYVPYTGAGKMSISPEEDIVEEIRMALMEAARETSTYLHKLAHAAEQEERRTIFLRYVDEVAEALNIMTGIPKTEIAEKLKKIAAERTAALEAKDAAMEEALEEVEEAAEAEIEEQD
ncbi:MAG TPA: DNA topoisomerase VI subunit B [Candidatus Norongarragalinales archaeon]|jgi:DNA topoisomerase-6 subunit B|nr:DNA topoisomerase VI subunit B [Candidatus Norongarragalinales archaeon]